METPNWHDAPSVKRKLDCDEAGVAMPQMRRCPNCNKTIRIPDSAVGKQVRCPACRAEFAIAKNPVLEPALVAASAAEPRIGAEPRSSGQKETQTAAILNLATLLSQREAILNVATLNHGGLVMVFTAGSSSWRQYQGG